MLALHQILLHWLTTFLVLTQFGSAYVWDLLEKGTPWRIGLIPMHLAFGIVLARTVLIRVVWKLKRKDRLAPPVKSLQHLAATTVHTLLYCLLVAQVVPAKLHSNVAWAIIAVAGCTRRQR